MDLGKKILLDSDVIRHFINGESVSILKRIFPNQLYLVCLVEEELRKSRKVNGHIDYIIGQGIALKFNFPSKKSIREEYFALIKSGRDIGESACMAIARHDNSIVASSNLKDIKAYCITNGIDFLTTMDFLYIAFRRKIMTEGDIDTFISKVLKAGSKLPFTNFKLYLVSKPMIETWYLEEGDTTKEKTA